MLMLVVRISPVSNRLARARERESERASEREREREREEKPRKSLCTFRFVFPFR